ncbi:transcription factor, contains a PHD finger motif [Tilletia horrida]|nr:transcription factor, contains a PHD finger motif [Tilletia horrida]
MADDAGVDAARRAYIAKTAPHLLPAQPSVGAPTPPHEELHEQDQQQQQHHHHHHQLQQQQQQQQQQQPARSEEGGSSSSTGKDTPASAPAGISAHTSFAQDLFSHVARMPALQHAPGSGTMYTTLNTPTNRVMWRYTAAGPDPAHLPRVLFREVPMAPLGVHWDWIDRSSYTKISLDASTISTDRGWRSGRANVGVRWGAWYYEVDYLEPEELSHAAVAAAALTSGFLAQGGRSASPSTGVGTGTASPRPHQALPPIPASGSATPQLASSGSGHQLSTTPAVIAPPPIGPLPAPMKDGPHLRLGWGRREASLNAPAGSDGYSYAIRDSTGQKCHLSRMAPYAEQGFVPGDTIGIYIYIPPPPYITNKLRRPKGSASTPGTAPIAPTDASLPPRERHVRRKRVPIRYKGQLYFESLEYQLSREMEHLMDRSRRGVQKTIPTDEGQPDIIGIDCPLSNDPAVVTAWEKTQAEKKAAAAAAQQKKRRLPGQPMANPNANLNLRPLPVLKGSFVGFSINGKWQGVAFRDLIDFRPFTNRRREHNTHPYRPPSNSSKNGKDRARDGKRAQGSRGSARSTPVPGHESGASTDSSDTSSHSSAYSSDSSSSSRGGGGGNHKGKGKIGGGHHHHHRRSESPDAAGGKSTTDRILAARHNPWDDGETGYFPFVSMFGGARARINAGPTFRYGISPDAIDGDANFRAELAQVEHGNVGGPSASKAKGNLGTASTTLDAAEALMREGEALAKSAEQARQNRLAWRPLSERYEEYYAEQLAYDLADERRLGRRLHRRHGRRRRGEFDPYDLLRHSGDGTGVRGANAMDAGGIAGALGEGGDGVAGSGLGGEGTLGVASEADFGGLLAGADSGTGAMGNALGGGAGSASASAPGAVTGSTTKGKSNPTRTKAGRRESGKTQRRLPLLRKKKKSKKEKQAAAEKAKETKRRRKEEEEAAALLAAEEGDGDEEGDEDADGDADGDDGDGDGDAEQDGDEGDDDGRDSGSEGDDEGEDEGPSERKRPKLSAA